jgi:succinylglutamate desuccinylase
MNKHNLLALGCTHGDEQIGKYLFDKYPQIQSDFYDSEFVLANPKACFLNQRFIDADLNRSFPGIVNGNWEQSRAFELQNKFGDLMWL